MFEANIYVGSTRLENPFLISPRPLYRCGTELRSGLRKIRRSLASRTIALQMIWGGRGDQGRRPSVKRKVWGVSLSLTVYHAKGLSWFFSLN